MSMNDLEENALKLERRQATMRLIAYLTDATDEAKQAPGRYAYFSALLVKHPPLYLALLDNDQTRVRGEWAKVQAAHQADMRFLHALTIIYWETALAKLARQQDAEREWVIGTGLWIMLLSADEFWDYFARDRWMNEQGERVDLSAQQQEELRETMLNDILDLHGTTAKQYFAVGNYAQARVHLRCLDMCRARSQQFFSALQQYALPCIASLNDHTLDWIATRAFKEIDEWCVALTADAEKVANDAEAIKNLPDGIRLNYSGGLSALQPFIDLNIPVARVLCAVLAWYNGWCYDLLLLEDKEQFEQTVLVAQKVADQLLPLSVKGKGYEQENKLLSEHFLLRGLITKDSVQVVKCYEEALAWDPSNQAARDLMEQEQEYALEKDNIQFIKDAEEAFTDKRFDKAILEASRVPGTSKLIVRAQAILSAAYFGRGIEAADAKNFDRAVSDLRKSLKLYQGDDEEVLSAIKSVLCSALNAHAVQIVEAAPSYSQSTAARRACQLLEEALIFDPDNENARKNLTILRQNP